MLLKLFIYGCLNRIPSSRRLEREAGRVCAVVVEPLVQAAAGMLTHDPEFLRGVRALCDLERAEREHAEARGPGVQLRAVADDDPLALQAVEP